MGENFDVRKAVSIVVAVVTIVTMFIYPPLFGVGFALFVFAGITAKNFSYVMFKAHSVQITARVTSVRLVKHLLAERDTPCVSYTVDGLQYSDIPLLDHTAEVGDYVEISYNRHRPEEVKVPVSVFMWIMQVIATVLLLLMVWCLFH